MLRQLLSEGVKAGDLNIMIMETVGIDHSTPPMIKFSGPKDILLSGCKHAHHRCYRHIRRDSRKPMVGVGRYEIIRIDNVNGEQGQEVANSPRGSPDTIHVTVRLPEIKKGAIIHQRGKEPLHVA